MDALLAYRWPGNIRELKNVIERVVLKAGGPHHPADRSADRRRPDRGDSVLGLVRRRRPWRHARRRADELAALMLTNGESFWSVVYPLFMSRDLTRTDLRKIIQIGLETHERQLPLAGPAVQHADRGLQAVPELPPQARLPPAVPAVPRGSRAPPLDTRSRAGRGESVIRGQALLFHTITSPIATTSPAPNAMSTVGESHSKSDCARYACA